MPLTAQVARSHISQVLPRTNNILLWSIRILWWLSATRSQATFKMQKVVLFLCPGEWLETWLFSTCQDDLDISTVTWALMGQGRIVSLKDAWYRKGNRECELGKGPVALAKKRGGGGDLLWCRLFLPLDASVGSAPDIKLSNYLVIVGGFFFEGGDCWPSHGLNECRKALQLYKDLSGIVNYSLLWECVHLFYLWALLPPPGSVWLRGCWMWQEERIGREQCFSCSFLQEAVPFSPHPPLLLRRQLSSAKCISYF